MGPRFRCRLAGIALGGLLGLGFASPAVAQPPLRDPCPPVCPPVRNGCPPQCPTPFIPEPVPAEPGKPAPTQPATPAPSPTTATPSFGELEGGAGVGSNVALSPGGYIDNAVPRNMIRSRFDYGFDMNRPDRAEFFYAAWRELSFHRHGVLNERGTFQTTNGRGPDGLPSRLDYQEVSTYLEGALTPRLSVSLDVPFRMVQLTGLFEDREGGFEPPLPDPHEAIEEFGTSFGGLSDIVLGVKYAMIAEQDHYLTFQFRTFSPSGYARHMLGTGHWSVEPGLLYSGRMSDQVSLFGQAKVWVPIDGGHTTDGREFSAPILIYGLGVGYDVMNRGGIRVTPVSEVVGWSVTNGFQTIFSPDHTPLNLIGDENIPEDHGVAKVSTTIVNVKLGVRTAIGERDDVYIGFGKCVTGERWYNEIIRVEYRHTW